ncbi:MAG: Mini-ribonuclease 3 [Fervidobacterium sp.]
MESSSICELFPVPKVNPEELSIDTLAYLGDAVFNLYAKLFVLQDVKVTQLHKMANKYVSREGQSKVLHSIYPLLTEKELSIVKRGINSKGARKHGNDLKYKESTGFEALVGFLYITDRKRLSFLLKEGSKWEEV